jgi:hypothetical protein
LFDQRRRRADIVVAMRKDGFLAATARYGGSFSGTTSSQKTLRASERGRTDVARARRRWMREQGLFDQGRLVFLDETATSTNMTRHVACLQRLAPQPLEDDHFLSLACEASDGGNLWCLIGQ